MITVAPTYVSGSLANLFLGVWRREASMAGVDGLYGDMGALARAWPAGIGIVLFIEPQTILPTPDVREHLIQQRRAIAPHLLAAAVVAPGESLWGSTVRTIAVTLGLSSGATYPSKSVAALEPAAEWQVASMGADFGVPADAIVRGVASLRAQTA